MDPPEDLYFPVVCCAPPCAHMPEARTRGQQLFARQRIRTQKHAGIQRSSHFMPSEEAYWSARMKRHEELKAQVTGSKLVSSSPFK